MTALDANSTSGLQDQLDELAARARREFVDVSDFIWKAPRLIEHERELELSKLDAYFPNHPELRKRRWDLESHKLDHTFPYLIAVGNLFGAVSLFESYLLLLAGEIQPHVAVQLRDVKGQGVSRLFRFFRLVGMSPEQVFLHEQVQAAIKIRNCLTHASGMLAWSRESCDLRRIQSAGAYLSPEHRRMRLDRGSRFDEVLVGESAFGDRLVVDNRYSHVLCSYLHTYYSALCEAAKSVFSSPEYQ
ncbi:hypothetical protein SAMN05216201_1082 [Pseudomonas linyingensis]|uniref:Uncharacterized protein n=1 Tax=Pseudomonas linyingensis TaxID=915471 RepID=A0A1H6YCM7_9PSED|nr:hypothetical protein [Pseudomonas linyingensis]SEJ39023.1 hypothetical protein SAMN05216201_1082 [Pseudomonas linyingensis]